MQVMILGLLIWSTVHLFPSVAPNARAGLIKRWGENAYKGSFSLLIFAALALIVYGWRLSVPVPVYNPPPFLIPFAFLLVAAGFILMGAAAYPSRVKRPVRHPQLTGLSIWALAHLLVNGDSRSLLLFAWLAGACWR